MSLEHLVVTEKKQVKKEEREKEGGGERERECPSRMIGVY